MKVCDLRPGQVVENPILPFGDLLATVVACDDHPEYEGFTLVAWYIVTRDGHRWSFDALLPEQEVGDAWAMTPVERMERLRQVLDRAAVPPETPQDTP